MIILSSIWTSAVAISIYSLIGAAIIVIASILIYRHVSQLKQKVEIEKQVAEIKLRFFTNISHELRTPLTLISGPVDNILDNEDLSPEVRIQLEIVQSNANRMMRLVNQLLDFRKLQNHKLKLHVQNVLLKPLVEDTFSNFRKEAESKHINYQLINDAPGSTLWVDKSKFDTILYNLLSNAFKYTPEGHAVTVRVSEKPNFVLLSVADTGIGIPKDKRNVLFERFSSNNEINASAEKTGTGIGLNFVKELVDLHQGFIEVESEVGVGSTFTVLFRMGKSHFGNDVEIVFDDKLEIEQATIAPTNEETLDPRKQTVLIVDDNAEMRQFLRAILYTQYNILLAEDGTQAFEKAKEMGPDLIITDWMMPQMSGLELTQLMKNDPNTSYIPIILLTAKTTIESRLEALQDGADDYLTKPFSPDYLKARIENILRERERLRTTYRQNLLKLEPQRIDMPSPNETFIAKLLDYMEKNVENNELSVDEIVREMALGRTVFFNKLKGLTGLSPVEFIREFRIKRAAQLLETGNLNVTEITYLVGMNDSRYFSKCFKQMYGMTPTEYKNLHQKANG